MISAHRLGGLDDPEELVALLVGQILVQDVWRAVSIWASVSVHQLLRRASFSKPASARSARTAHRNRLRRRSVERLGHISDQSSTSRRASHEEVRHPECQKRVPCPVLAPFRRRSTNAMCCQAPGTSPWPLRLPLVDVACRVIEHLGHWHDAVRGPVGALDVCATRPHVYRQCPVLRDVRTPSACHSVDGVLEHVHK
jgi:hypothetical protein